MAADPLLVTSTSAAKPDPQSSSIRKVTTIAGADGLGLGLGVALCVGVTTRVGAGLTVCGFCAFGDVATRVGIDAVTAGNWGTTARPTKGA
jgi:hypothetical protein